MGAQSPTKIPNLSACAGSDSPVSDHTAIEPATEAIEAAKSHCDKLTFFIIIPFFNCAPDRIRTYDPRFRKPVLYPAELREHLTSIKNFMHTHQAYEHEQYNKHTRTYRQKANTVIT